MHPRLPWILLLIALPLWLAASYGLRYGLMEDPHWVGTCVAEAGRWECQLRSNLGWLIHFRALGWAALVTSVLAFLYGDVLAMHWRCWRCCLDCRHWRSTTPVWRSLRW